MLEEVKLTLSSTHGIKKHELDMTREEYSVKFSYNRWEKYRIDSQPFKKALSYGRTYDEGPEGLMI
jgi:hypothetical protein